jgi:ribosomal protein S18 acetylase RimI-like enzyme
MKLKFTVEMDPPPDRSRLISDPLIDFNESQAGDRRIKNFALFAKDASGVVLGGLLGSTHWNHFFVSALFVHERFRKVGIGRKLMNQAEDQALACACDAIFLDTFDFQARGFYEKLGFEVFGVLENYPLGHKRFYMVKQIVRAPSPPRLLRKQQPDT